VSKLQILRVLRHNSVYSVSLKFSHLLCNWFWG